MLEREPQRLLAPFRTLGREERLAEVGADPGLRHDGSDHVHREVVVGEGRDAAAEHLGAGEPGAELDVLLGQVGLDRPDVVVEPLVGLHVLGDAAQGDHRGVGVAVDEPRHGHLPAGIDDAPGPRRPPDRALTDSMTPSRTTIVAFSTNPIRSCSSWTSAVQPVMTRSAEASLMAPYPTESGRDDARGYTGIAVDPRVMGSRRRHLSVAAAKEDRMGATGQKRQVLFIQGAGADTHDRWDDKLVDSLQQGLGDGYEIRYPRMPDEDDPSVAAWSQAIRRSVADLDDGAVVVGHSVGGAILVHVLAQQLPAPQLATLVLIATPFVGDGGSPPDDFELPTDLGTRLAGSLSVHVVHGLADDTVPPSHADLYARAIPRARLHLVPGRDHQMGDDLGEVAELIRGEPGSR